MKKIFFTILLCVCFSEVVAGPTIYGKGNLSVQFADENGDSNTEVVSNASRIGLKGKEKVNDELEAIYQFEFEVFADDGDKDGKTFTQRNIFVGLKGGFGTVKAGKFDTPFKVAQKKIDLFNDLEGDIKHIITANDNRPGNIVSYSTPSSLGAITANFAYISSENEEADGKSLSVTFEKDDLYVALAHDQDVEGDGYKATRLVGQYSVDDFQFGALVEQASSEGASSVKAWFVSVRYKMDAWALKAQYGQSDIVEDGGDTLSLGADYKLSKNLKAFGYYTTKASDEIVVGALDRTEDNDYLGVGLELKF